MDIGQPVKEITVVPTKREVPGTTEPTPEKPTPAPKKPVREKEKEPA